MATNYQWSEERQQMVPVSEFTISNEVVTEGTPIVESDAIKAAKAALLAAKHALAAAKGKPIGKKGKQPLPFEATLVSGNVDKAKLESFKALHSDKSNSELLRLMLDLALTVKAA